MSTLLTGNDAAPSTLKQNNQYESSANLSSQRSDQFLHSGLKQVIVPQVPSSVPTSYANVNDQPTIPSILDVQQYLVKDMNAAPSKNLQPPSSAYYWPLNHNIHEGSLLKYGSNSHMMNHHVYPSPEEKIPHTPAPSFLLNSPAIHHATSNQASSSSQFGSNRSYGSAASNYHPMTFPAGCPMDQDAMVSLLFTKSTNGAPMQLDNSSSYGPQSSHYQYHLHSPTISDNFYHASQNLSSSYPSSINNQTNNRVAYQNPSSLSGNYGTHHQYQHQAANGPLRINTRLNVPMNTNGMSSSLASSLASARSSIDGGMSSFFASPLSEPGIISHSQLNGKRGKIATNANNRRHSAKQASASPYQLTHNLDEQPREQRLKFPDDMYTPKWVRYQGAAKEGLCDLCEGPGKWLQLKNSAFWYHKQFVHGISSVTSLPFSRPTDTRLVWMSEVIANRHYVFLASEGFCHCCSDWIPQAKNRKRHSQTCDSKEEAIALLSSGPFSITCYEPAIKAVAVRDKDGSIILPPGMKVTSSMIRDLINEPLGSTWFRHAFKCHAAAVSSNNNRSSGTIVSSISNGSSLL